MTKLKLIKLIVFLTSLFSLTGCVTTYEDLVPNEDEFGLWDGNYIYQGNKRTKTSGESTEVLITEVEHENTTYQLDETIDYIFNNDLIYFISKASEKDFLALDSQPVSLLLKYSPLSTEVDVLYFTNEKSEFLSEFYYVSPNYFVFLKEDTSNNGFLKIDLSTKETTHIDAYSEYLLLEDYLVVRSNGHYQYTKLDVIDFKNVVEAHNYNYSFEIIERNNQKYFLILSSQFIEAYTFYSELAYFNIEEESLQIVWPMGNQKNLQLIGHDYFIVGVTKSYDYVSSIRKVDSLKHEVLTSHLLVNNELYKIDYSRPLLSTEHIFTFDKDVDYTSGFVNEDGHIIFKARWIKEGSQLFPGGHKSADYIFNPNTKQLKKFQQESNSIIINQMAIETMGLKYYFVIKTYGSLLSRNSAYFFYRLDLETDKAEMMQFFAFEAEEIRGLRYSQEFWKSDFYFDQNNFLILSY